MQPLVQRQECCGCMCEDSKRLSCNDTPRFEETPKLANNHVAEQAFLIASLIKVLSEVFSEHSWGTPFQHHTHLHLGCIIWFPHMKLLYWFDSTRARRRRCTKLRDVAKPRLSETKQSRALLIRPDRTWKKQNHFSVWSRHGMCYITAGDVNSLKQHCIKRFFQR